MKFLKAQCDSTTTQTFPLTSLTAVLKEVARGCFSISSIKEMLFSVLLYNNDICVRQIVRKFLSSKFGGQDTTNGLTT